MIITQRTNFKEQNDFKSVLVQASILFVNLKLSPKEFDMLTLKTEGFLLPLMLIRCIACHLKYGPIAVCIVKSVTELLSYFIFSQSTPILCNTYLVVVCKLRGITL